MTDYATDDRERVAVNLLHVAETTGTTNLQVPGWRSHLYTLAGHDLSQYTRLLREVYLSKIPYHGAWQSPNLPEPGLIDADDFNGIQAVKQLVVDLGGLSPVVDSPQPDVPLPKDILMPDRENVEELHQEGQRKNMEEEKDEEEEKESLEQISEHEEEVLCLLKAYVSAVEPEIVAWLEKQDANGLGKRVVTPTDLGDTRTIHLGNVPENLTFCGGPPGSGKTAKVHGWLKRAFGFFFDSGAPEASELIQPGEPKVRGSHDTITAYEDLRRCQDLHTMVSSSEKFVADQGYGHMRKVLDAIEEDLGPRHGLGVQNTLAAAHILWALFTSKEVSFNIFLDVAEKHQYRVTPGSWLEFQLYFRQDTGIDLTDELYKQIRYIRRTNLGRIPCCHDSGWDYSQRSIVLDKMLWCFDDVTLDAAWREVLFKHFDRDFERSYLHMIVQFWHFNKVLTNTSNNSVLVLSGACDDVEALKTEIKTASELISSLWVLNPNPRKRKVPQDIAWHDEWVTGLVNEYHELVFETKHYTWRPTADAEQQRLRTPKIDEIPILTTLRTYLHGIHQEFPILGLSEGVYDPYSDEISKIEIRFQGRIRFLQHLLSTYRTNLAKFVKASTELPRADGTIEKLHTLRQPIDIVWLKALVLDASVGEAATKLKRWLRGSLKRVETHGKESLVKELMRVSIRSDLQNEQALFASSFTTDGIQYGLGTLSKPVDAKDTKFGRAWLSESLLRDAIRDQFSRARHEEWFSCLCEELLIRTDNTSSFGKALELAITWVSNLQCFVSIRVRC